MEFYILKRFLSLGDKMTTKPVIRGQNDQGQATK
jgi:hypothetical protein